MQTKNQATATEPHWTEPNRTKHTVRYIRIRSKRTSSILHAITVIVPNKTNWVSDPLKANQIMRRSGNVFLVFRWLCWLPSEFFLHYGVECSRTTVRSILEKKWHRLDDWRKSAAYITTTTTMAATKQVHFFSYERNAYVVVCHQDLVFVGFLVAPAFDAAIPVNRISIHQLCEHKWWSVISTNVNQNQRLNGVAIFPLLFIHKANIQ